METQLGELKSYVNPELSMPSNKVDKRLAKDQKTASVLET